jgi:hypothetical protein
VIDQIPSVFHADRTKLGINQTFPELMKINSPHAKIKEDFISCVIRHIEVGASFSRALLSLVLLSFASLDKHLRKRLINKLFNFWQIIVQAYRVLAEIMGQNLPHYVLSLEPSQQVAAVEAQPQFKGQRPPS